ncbi:MAG: hypothetical protein WA783_01320 [Phormidesmis sp.]
MRKQGGCFFKRRLWQGLGQGIGASAIACLALADASYAACEFFSEPQRYNTQTDGEVIVIGYQLERPYRVVMFSEDRETLDSVRACVLDAFVTRSRIGSYIQVASFDRRDDAETISRILRGSGYQARVIYRNYPISQ